MKTTATPFAGGRVPALTISGKQVSVAFPDTVLEEHSDSLRDKTAKLGQIARTCSVFGVDTVQVFRDPRGRGESALIKRILEYLETPQYLRRRLFALDDSLKFAGLLPPLRIPSHKAKIRMENLRVGEYREGVVLADGLTVDIGFEKPMNLRYKVAANKRVTTRLTSVAPLEGVLSDRAQTGEYWGYTVEVKGVDEILSDSRYSLKVATSRYGTPLSGTIVPLGEAMRASRGVVVIFGSPSRGLLDMIKNLRQRVPFVVNLYPEQQTATVRTEEAMSSGLYLLEVVGAMKNESLKADRKSG
jgi:predicted SPOUT superfamily RNA methylase MTH1